MSGNEEPTAALTSPAAVVATLLLFVAVGGFVVLAQLLPADDPDAMAAGTAPPVAPGALTAGMSAPDFTLTSLEDEVVSLSDYAGRPVMINFWASWCPPCREEFPLLAQARADQAGTGFEILGVTHDDGPEFAREFVEESGAGWPMLTDPGDAVWGAYDVVGLPTSFFVDADGRIGRVHLGPVDEAQLLEALATIGLSAATDGPG